MKLDDLGNFEGYKPKSRTVRPYGPAYEEGIAAVKIYSMLPESSKPFTDSEMSLARYFICEELRSGRVEPKIGLGFAVLSEDVLNINLWGGEFPSLLNPNIYTWKTSTCNWGRGEIASDGAYCAWEGELVGYESRLWREYMLSGRRAADKKWYLENSYSGEIRDVPGGINGMDVSDLGIMSRTATGLKEGGIETVGDLLTKTDIQILSLRNIGHKGFRSIEAALKQFNLTLKTR